MIRKTSDGAVALLETAPTSAPTPVPPVRYSNSAQALYTMYADLVQLISDQRALETFLAERNADFDERAMDVDLASQQAAASLAILITQIAAGKLRQERLEEARQAKLGLVRNLNVRVHLEMTSAAAKRAHFRVIQISAAGKKTRAEIINSRTGDNIRHEFRGIEGHRPSGANVLREAEIIVRLSREVFGDVHAAEHEFGQIQIDPGTDFLSNADPAQ